MLVNHIPRFALLMTIAALVGACASPQVAPASVVTTESAPSQSSPDGTPSLAPSPSSRTAPTASDTPAASELGPASIATTTAEGIRLRTEPSVSAAQVNTLIAGTQVIILSGPAADPSDPSLEWWEVLPNEDFCDECSLDLHPGWMTTGPTKDWLRPVDFDCPESSTFTAEGWKDTHPLLQCFGGRPITLEGIVDYWCCRGITLGDTQPAWLAGDYSNPLIARLRGGTDDAYSWGPELHLVPDSGVTLGARGTVARITGHFDDPAAETCRTTLTEDEWELNPDLRWVTTPSLAIYHCRTQFVVDSVDVLDFIPLPTHPPQG